MIHKFTYDWRPWRAETSGSSREVEGLRSVGVRFTHEETDWPVYGSLNPVDAERPTDARIIVALEATLVRQHGPLELTLHEMMWSNDGPELKRDKPIQYETRGLPSGFETIFVGQNLKVRPIRWRMTRTRNGLRAWGGDYETPQAALAALQAELEALR